MNSIPLSLSLCHTRERLPGGAFNCRVLKNACVRVFFFFFFHTSEQPLSSTHALFKLLALFATLANFQIGFVFHARIIIAPHYNTQSFFYHDYPTKMRYSPTNDRLLPVAVVAPS